MPRAHFATLRAMSKSPLFSRLRRLSRKHAMARPATAQIDGNAPYERRTFLKASAAALSTLAMPAMSTVLDGCSKDQGSDRNTDSSPGDNARVAIIGAGMAGLHCAYRLKQAGLTARVYEASDRTGGRMFTAQGSFPDGQVAELGGELIDSIHLTMQKLAEEFSIQLDDRDEVAASIEEVWWVDGKPVSDAVIVAQFSEVAPLMSSLAQMADEDEDAYAKLDVIPLATWLEENLANQPELRSVLSTAYCCEYGLETNEQSVLNLLYLVGSDDPDPFRIFGDSDERYHTHTGSQTFPDKLALGLKGQISLNHRLIKVKKLDDVFLLTFEDGAGNPSAVEADQVVFALPFSTLRKVDLDEAGLSAGKLKIIREMGYGTNAKVMGAFNERVWLTAHDASGSVTSDLPFQQCWDTSPGQAGATGILTNFLGGKQGEASAKGSAEAWYSEVMLPGAEQVFPGALAAYLSDSAVRMHWPTYPFNLGSYACYRPGQWAFYGQEGVREGNLHFCGEHCSLDFQGFMEGAAETGALVAAAILGDLELPLPEALAELVDLKLVVEQPAFGALRARPSFWARRREILHALAGHLLTARG